jgi:hypothetical protein
MSEATPRVLVRNASLVRRIPDYVFFGATSIEFELRGRLITRLSIGDSLLVLQRDFTLLRDFMYYYETLPLRRVEGRLSNRERVRLR